MEDPSLVSAEISNDSIGSSLSPRAPIGTPIPSKFKGVVAQPNGHWGAQIYAHHHRIWLGTFKSELEAAAAYDSAAIKLRTGPIHRNFPWNPSTAREPDFQARFTPEAILSMIKDGSYAARFSEYLRAHQDIEPLHPCPHYWAPSIGLCQLFQKELTPSDVGKLNRLVIPKKYALKFFPRIPDRKGGKSNGSNNDNNNGNNNNNNNVDDLELVFFERSMRRSWKLRYCYWKSSQSFVFTRGWNRFAKEKKLRARDRVIFSSYETGDQKLCIIDVAYFEGGWPVEEKEAEINGGQKGVVEEASSGREAKGFRLFGFHIA